MKDFFQSSFFYIVVIAILGIYVIYFGVTALFQNIDLQVIRLQQLYAFMAVVSLYIALLIDPIISVFPAVPGKMTIKHCKKGFVAATFIYGFIHAYISFFGQLGGFDGIFYLGNKYIIAITLSFTALLILILVLISFFDFILDKIPFSKRSWVTNALYIAGLFIIIHALLLGSHFRDLNTFIPQVFFVALGFLLFLDAICIDNFIQKKSLKLLKYTARTIICLLIVGLIVYLQLN